MQPPKDPKANGKDKIPSANQVQQMINKRQCPKSVKRMDKARLSGSPQDHIHFKDGSALYRDGTWRHRFKKLTKIEKTFLIKIGFKLP